MFLFSGANRNHSSVPELAPRETYVADSIINDDVFRINYIEKGNKYDAS